MSKLRDSLRTTARHIKGLLVANHAQFDMDEYVKAMSRSLYTDKNKDFIDFIKSPYRSLTINLDQPTKVQSLRVSLSEAEFLHIHSIAFLDERGKRIKIPAKTTRVKASSHYGNTKQRIADGQLLKATGKHTWAIHTNDDENPWIIVSLAQPQLVSAIVIKNRQDTHGYRAIHLNVAIQTPGQKTWVTVSRPDHLGFKNVRQGFDRIKRDYGLDKIDGGQHIHQAVTYAIIGDYWTAHKQFRHVPATQKSALLKAANRHILASSELEWSGNHGVYRTFRFWKLPEKQQFIKMTSNVVSDLQSLSKDVSLGFGSAMAAVRDHDLIPHDDDTDIMIAFQPSQAATFKEAKQLVKKHLEKHGYELTGNFFNHWHVRRDGLKADVFVGIYESDGTIGWYPHPRGILKRSDMFPAKSVKLLGVPCLIPRNAERYLSVIYGDTWRIPDPTWTPKWDEKKYADLA